MSLISRPTRFTEDPFLNDPFLNDPFFNQELWPSTRSRNLWPSALPSSTFFPSNRMWPTTIEPRGLFPGTDVWRSRDILPRVDYNEHLDKITVRMELPGYTQNDIKVNLNNNILTIRGEKKSSIEEPWTSERTSQSFSQQFRLPSYADQTQTKAEIVNGVLQIDIGKRDYGRNILVQ